MAQKRLTSFFGDQNPTSTKKRPRQLSRNNCSPRNDGSSFGSCPMCQVSFPLHKLQTHAADCTGTPEPKPEMPAVLQDGSNRSTEPTTIPNNVLLNKKPHTSTSETNRITSSSLLLKPACEPIPGLFIFENFITEQEEAEILHFLDAQDSLPWKPSSFNGKHMGKRWGVHCNLRDRRVDAPENPLPDVLLRIVLPKLQHLPQIKGCVPNEANAIDYRRKQGHWLQAHVDDRKLSKEPIANLSLTGDCSMTFRNVAPHRNLAAKEAKVLLKRRCLQVLTGTCTRCASQWSTSFLSPIHVVL